MWSEVCDVLNAYEAIKQSGGQPAQPIKKHSRPVSWLVKLLCKYFYVEDVV